MAKISRFCLVTPNWGRSISDDAWQTIDLAHINLWKSAITLLGERKLTHEKISYSVAIDWKPILRAHERSYSAMRYLEKNAKMPPDERFKEVKFPRRSARNSITVTSTGKDSRRSINVAENVAHDIFLIMNIAAPGSCDFNRASLTGAPYEVELSLSNFYFEAALQLHLDDKWPPSRVMDLKKVIIWFDAVRDGPSQVPRNRMEKVLFALLHISKIEVSPMVVIWIFYAFESLLETRVGENFSVIVSRLSLLLEASKEQSDLLRKKMRKLYEIRSAIVHGGFDVIHTMHDETLDGRVQDSFNRLIEATEFGYAILLVSLQKIIENGWRFPRFGETIGGDIL
jgi:hypothetical protein